MIPIQPAQKKCICRTEAMNSCLDTYSQLKESDIRTNIFYFLTFRQNAPVFMFCAGFLDIEPIAVGHFLNKIG